MNSALKIIIFISIFLFQPFAMAAQYGLLHEVMGQAANNANKNENQMNYFDHAGELINSSSMAQENDDMALINTNQIQTNSQVITNAQVPSNNQTIVEVNNKQAIVEANNEQNILESQNSDDTIASKNSKKDSNIKSNENSNPNSNTNAKPVLKPADVYSKAYIFSYPLVLFDATKKLVTHTPEPNSTLMRAPINQFVHAKEIPAAELEIPDCTLDTLYSSAFLDLSKEPIILSLPNSDRFYLMQLLDAWTEVFYSAGTRTNNNQAVNLALVGPHWKGTIPKNIEVIKSPTNYVWIIGRTEVKNEQDYDKVHEQQNNYKLIPLSFWGGNYTPSKVLLTTPNEPILPIEQVDGMDDVYYFTKFLSLMAINPPHPEDTEMVEALKTVGIIPGQTIDPTKMNGNQISAIAAGFREAQQKLGAIIRNDRLPKKGWDIQLKNVGKYNTDYSARASMAFNSIGANLPQDIVFPSILTDSKGNQLRGDQDYVIHFDKDNLPPTHAFWSITMYDKKNLLVPNDIKRYSLDSRSNLVYNPDGSLDLYIKYDSPQNDFERNWLPTPEGDFKLTMRIYWPKESLLDGQWTPPEVVKIEKSKDKIESNNKKISEASDAASTDEFL